MILFYKEKFYTQISVDKEFYVLPIFLNKIMYLYFSNNYFYEKWNEIDNE